MSPPDNAAVLQAFDSIRELRKIRSSLEHSVWEGSQARGGPGSCWGSGRARGAAAVSACTFHCADNPEILEGPGASITRHAGEACRSPGPTLGRLHPRLGKGAQQSAFLGFSGNSRACNSRMGRLTQFVRAHGDPTVLGKVCHSQEGCPALGLREPPRGTEHWGRREGSGWRSPCPHVHEEVSLP